ncbi:MAG TPA: hypothetical protein VFT72_12910 [Opitutaceae bacterium]|nr:hypothetical protein [Opitutaceae bacterium]
MKLSRRNSVAWIGALLLSAGFLLWCDTMRVRRAERVTEIAQENVPPLSRTSPTGYAGGTRELIVPEHLASSYEWIAETQQMFAQHEWRVRSIDSENAPHGRAVHHASPYRWWLGAVAWADHAGSGRPIGLSVERAALFADPLLHLGLLVAAAAFVAWQFGAAASVVVSLGGVTLFPFAAGFLPTVPDDSSLALGLNVISVLLLLAGLRAAAAPAAGDGESEGNAARATLETSTETPVSHRGRRWFFVAGAIGGLGAWIDLALTVPLQVGVALGACVVAAISRRAAREAAKEMDGANAPLGALSWRAWAIGGALTSGFGYLVEYFPGHFTGWELRAIHPLYCLAWLGGGELLARGTEWMQRAKPRRRSRWFFGLLLGLAALAAVAALPLAMWKTKNGGFLAIDMPSFRLTKEADGVLAASLLEWLKRDGWSATTLSTLLVVLPILGALWIGLRRKSEFADRAAILFLAGPLLVGLGFAFFRLRWWQVVDALAFVQAALATRALLRSQRSLILRGAWLISLVIVAGFGVVRLLRMASAPPEKQLSFAEVEGLVERDLAHWLAQHSPKTAKPIVLAPPDITSSLNFYGSLRGLGTLSWENKDGLAVALHIAIASTRDEAEALIASRGVTHIVIPSWNRFFENYTRSTGRADEETFHGQLLHWQLPLWLRPIPYELPRITGFQEQSVVILKVVDEQDAPSAEARIAEYFVEMGQLERARETGETLRRFPGNLSALVARGQVAFALRDADAFPAVMEAITQRMAAHADRSLPWDRRVSLAVILARGQQMDLARAQIERCLAEIDEPRLRSLTTYGLFHLEYLRKTFGLELPRPELQPLIRELLPATRARETAGR